MLRDGPDGLETFMVVRHHQIDFASGALVFPGGKVDQGDFDVRDYCHGVDDADDTAVGLMAGALREIARCLKPDGLAVIESHMTDEPTMRAADYRAHHPGLDDRFFDTNGTAWIFGSGLVDDAGASGLEAFVVRPFAHHDRHFHEVNGLKRDGGLLMAVRSPAGRARFALASD